MDMPPETRRSLFPQQPSLVSNAARASVTIEQARSEIDPFPLSAIPLPAASSSSVRLDAFLSSRTAAVPTTTTTTAGAAMESRAWLPTRLTSPYCVLSATGVHSDFYTSGLSWGRERLALALHDDILLFHPNLPRVQPARAILNSSSSSGSAAAHCGEVDWSARRRPASVAVSRASDTSCFVGFVDGSASLYTATDSGVLAPALHFALPESPIVGYATQLSNAAGTATMATAGTKRLSSMLCKATPAFTSVGALATCEQTPSSAAVGTSSCGLLLIDSRTPRPSLCFGGAVTAAAGSSTTASTTAAPSSSSPAGGAELQRQIWETLKCRERICGVSWNVSGSLVAVGTGSGTVHIWSVSSPRTPLQTLRMHQGTTVKAVCFHPAKPYELLVGGDDVDGLSVFDISSAAPARVWAGSTSAQTIQALYSPDGHHILTAHGSVATGDNSPSRVHQQQGRRGDWQGGAAQSDLGLVYNAVDALISEDQEETDSGQRGSRGGERRALTTHSLAVWHKRTTYGSPARDDIRERYFPFSRSTGARHRGGTSNDGGDGSFIEDAQHRPQTLELLYTLPGHRSRPLHLAAPFPSSSAGAAVGSGDPRDVLGCVASAAGGEDCTIRFWRVFREEPVMTTALGSSHDGDQQQGQKQQLSLARRSSYWGEGEEGNKDGGGLVGVPRELR